jgi:hypothetical protein
MAAENKELVLLSVADHSISLSISGEILPTISLLNLPEDLHLFEQEYNKSTNVYKFVFICNGMFCTLLCKGNQEAMINFTDGLNKYSYRSGALIDLLSVFIRHYPRLVKEEHGYEKDDFYHGEVYKRRACVLQCLIDISDCFTCSKGRRPKVRDYTGNKYDKFIYKQSLLVNLR